MRELVCKKCKIRRGIRTHKGGVQEGRSEGRSAGTVYICHLLLLQAKNAQEEQKRRKRSRRRHKEQNATSTRSITKKVYIYFEAEFKKFLSTSYKVALKRLKKSMPLSGM